MKTRRRRIVMEWNRTAYSSRDILKLCSRVHADYMKKKTQPETVRLRVKYRRDRRSYWGYAYYDNNIVILSMPKDRKIDSNELAHTFQHELDHCRGVRHSDMGECNRHRTGEKWHKDREYPDCSDIQIAFKAWTTKRKRAETAMRAINKKLRYYHRKQEKANGSQGTKKAA